ncbi:MAG TPA: tryptophan-rich sensory protein [Panacibacter sp.]|nr:tryptophan-rich sensory protein [Panacibacter sp.]HNP43644.1 tryptophan-rich sensory protein [Panacibacter sp.]
MKYKKLFLSLGITLLTGSVAGIATANAINTWYSSLNKPYFNPPNWLFAPVWTLLYVLMGIALYLVWKLPRSADRNRAITIFFVQLTLNFLWSFIFFSMQQTGWAFAEIVLLLIAILACIYFFEPLSKPATWLMLPYAAWVTFASVLNYSIWMLNK